jgi:TetR/AcrR family fatty acid metabolism transcriptional regulator
MVVNRTKRQVVSEYRTSELLEAARTVFSKKGFHDATIDDVAHEAGVAKGTVYLYFKSKQEIYLSALRDGIELLIHEMRTEAAAAESAETKLRKLIATKIAYFDKHRDFFRIFQSELGRMEKTMAECKDLYFEQAQIIEEVLKQGIKEGALQKQVNTRKAAFAVTDLTRGVAIQRLFGWSKTRLDDEVEFIMCLLWRGIAK